MLMKQISLRSIKKTWWIFSKKWIKSRIKTKFSILFFFWTKIRIILFNFACLLLYSISSISVLLKPYPPYIHISLKEIQEKDIKKKYEQIFDKKINLRQSEKNSHYENLFFISICDDFLFLLFTHTITYICLSLSLKKHAVVLLTLDCPTVYNNVSPSSEKISLLSFKKSFN